MTEETKIHAPFGLWKSPISAHQLSAHIRLSDLQWDTHSDTLVWREERSGQGVLVRRRVSELANRDLTGSLNVQARLGYGGGDFAVTAGNVFFVCNDRLYRQPLESGAALAIAPAWGRPAAPALSGDGSFLVYVLSVDGEDLLAVVDAEGRHFPSKLVEGNDFYMHPCVNPSGDRLAWICWNHPNMPWNGTGLYLGELDRSGALPRVSRHTLIEGDPSGRVSVFQPAFSPDGRFLSFVSDRSGWWNLYLYDLSTGDIRSLVEEEAEFGRPAWVQGLRTSCWHPSGQGLFVLRSKDGFTSLLKVPVPAGKPEPVIVKDYSALFQITASPQGDRLALIASAPAIPPRIVTLKPGQAPAVLQYSSPETTDPSYMSVPNPATWDVTAGEELATPAGRSRKVTKPAHCHGLYYPPANPDFCDEGLPPAIIKVHGGPTSNFEADFHDDTQFFSSRGYAVLELNYRGSSGFGKAYSHALEGTWGELDVEDTRSAAQFLISQRLADPNRLVLMGGSAGGFTVLLSLIRFPGTFRAAVCRYGVSNLFTLAQETHKFERHYLDSLIGPLPEKAALYRTRSPLFQAGRIADPVAIFQGDQDQVVPMDQAGTLVQVLAARNVPHVYRVYEGEGHGWRKRETVRRYFEDVEAFLKEFVVLG